MGTVERCMAEMEKVSNRVVLVILLVGMLVFLTNAALCVSVGVTGLYDPDNSDDITGELFVMLPHFWRLSSELGYGVTAEGVGKLWEMPPDRYQLLYSLVFSPELTKYAGPYLGAGFGFYKGEIPGEAKTDPIEYQFGAPHFFGGVMFNLGRLSLRGGARYVMHDKEYPVEPGGLLYQASLMFSFARRGKARGELAVSERADGTESGREPPDEVTEYKPPPEYQPPLEYEMAKVDELVTVKLVSEEISLKPEGTIRSVVIKDDKSGMSGHLVGTAGKLVLSFPDQPQVELPHLLDTMISLDGKAILQFGDRTGLRHPIRTDLYWVDSAGKVVGRLQDHYAGRAAIAMSNDGFTAVAGKLMGESDTVEMALYSPAGVKLWEVQLPEDQRVAQMSVMPGGQYIAALTTNSDAWLKDHRIEIRDQNGRPSETVSGMGVLQILVPLGDGSRIFVQAHSSYGIVDIATSELIWQRRGKVRMISPYGAALSPDGRTLFLLFADLRDGQEGVYGWQFLALDSATGEEMMLEYLPRKYTTTWDRVYEDVSDNEIRILAGQQRITYSWEKKEGGE